jgi:hypothetical protein
MAVVQCARWVAQYGEGFEAVVAEKNAANPLFNFLSEARMRQPGAKASPAMRFFNQRKAYEQLLAKKQVEPAAAPRGGSAKAKSTMKAAATAVRAASPKKAKTKSRAPRRDLAAAYAAAATPGAEDSTDAVDFLRARKSSPSSTPTGAKRPAPKRAAPIPARSAPNSAAKANASKPKVRPAAVDVGDRAAKPSKFFRDPVRKSSLSFVMLCSVANVEVFSANFSFAFLQAKQAELERHLAGPTKKKKRIKAKPRPADTVAASPVGGAAPVRVKPKATRRETAAAYEAAASTDMSPNTRTKEFGSL